MEFQYRDAIGQTLCPGDKVAYVNRRGSSVVITVRVIEALFREADYRDNVVGKAQLVKQWPGAKRQPPVSLYNLVRVPKDLEEVQP